MDLAVFFNENYLVFLLLGGLLIVMYAYRDVKLPASRNFIMIIFIMLAMCVASGKAPLRVQLAAHHKVSY